MNDNGLRELLHDTRPPEFDAASVADGARRLAHRRERTQRAALGGVAGIAVVAVALPLASQLVGSGGTVGMTASEADDVLGGEAPDAGATGGARPLDAGSQAKFVAACDAPEPPAGPAGPADLVGLVVCGAAGPRELSASEFGVVRDDLARELTLASYVNASPVTLLGLLPSGDVVFLRLADGRLDFGTSVGVLGPEALRVLEAAAR